jgi:hypothetical protein
MEYADDTLLLARTAEHTQTLLDAVVYEAAEYNMSLNIKKTELLRINATGDIYYPNIQTPRTDPHEYLTPIKIVEAETRYLGGWFTIIPRGK